MKIEYSKGFSNGQHLHLTITESDDVTLALATFARLEAVAEASVRKDLGYEPKGVSPLAALVEINAAEADLNASRVERLKTAITEVPPLAIADAIAEAKAEAAPIASEEDSIVALRGFVRSKGAPAAIALLAEFGVARVTELQPEQRAQFIERAA